MEDIYAVRYNCGRRSYYSTTYCSRCANSRYARCKICSKRGHISSYCTDLWRRYHLTIRDGPVIQPINTHMKEWKDQWCSGCACRGHFEHDCNYYNRTHSPTNPFIHSYNDVHDSINGSHRLEWQKTDNSGIAPWKVTDRHNKKHSSYELLPLDSSYATQTHWGGGENYPNNIRPPTSVPINLNLLQIYPHNQAFAPNVLQSNFYPQFPVYNPILTPAAHQFVPSNTISDNISAQNAATIISHVEDLQGSSDNPDQGSKNSKKRNKEEVCLPKAYAFKFLQKDGAQFLKILRKQTNLKITVENRIYNNGLRYVSMLEGQDDQILQAKDAIDRYRNILFASRSTNKKICFSKKLNIINLKNNIQTLEKPFRPWREIANSVYNKLKSIEEKVNIEKNPKTKLRLGNKVKMHYSILNAMVLGKLKIADGPKHMSILKQWTTKGDKNTVKSLWYSFKYIFNNESHLNINYRQAIQTFDIDKHLQIKMEIKTMLDSGISLCKTRNLYDALNDHKNLFNLVIVNNYSNKSFNKFKNNYIRLKELYMKHKQNSSSVC